MVGMQSTRNIQMIVKKQQVEDFYFDDELVIRAKW